jgi:hypothetical protein
MLLDADAIEVQLTPEQALSATQSAITAKRWRKYEIAGIRLVYTPFWVFSYDCFSEQGTYSARAALNAYTGELSDAITQLLDKPQKKSRSAAQHDFETEPGAVTAQEAKQSAVIKLAGRLGIEKEDVTASGFYRLYYPFWRVWVDVEKETYKIDIDAAYGTPFGFENVPERKLGWGEAAGETVKKLQSPQGLAELTTKSADAVAKAATGKESKGFLAWLLGTSEGRKVLLLVVVIVLAYYFFFIQGRAGA